MAAAILLGPAPGVVGMPAGGSGVGMPVDNLDSGMPAGGSGLGMPGADGRLVMWVFLVLCRVHWESRTAAPSAPSQALRVVL